MCRALCRSVALLVLITAALRAQDSASTRVAANILVSRDGSSPKAELHLAAHPRNPQILLGGALVFEAQRTCRLYRSVDGGWTWQSRDFPELREQGCTDPQVAFGGRGRAYFAVMTFVPDSARRKTSVISLYHSDDNGHTWNGPVYMGRGDSPDYPQVAVHARADQWDRVYISVNSRTGIGLYVSDDGGQSFSPQHAVVAHEGRYVASISLHVLSNRTIVAPFRDSEHFDPARLRSVNIAAAVSTDGGRTFTRVPIARQTRDSTNPLSLRSLPVACASGSSAGRFRDRAYCTWMDFRSGRSRLMFSRSSDGGATWEPARWLVADSPGSEQFRPAVAAAPNGTVAVSWCASADSDSYARYIAASVDGGASFLPAVRVSSELSPVSARGDAVFGITPNSPSRNAQREHFFVLNTVRATFPDGGDYVGLAASTDDVFHPFWSDSRSGNFEIWTARVSVGTPDARFPQTSVYSTGLNESLELVFDPARHSSEPGVVTIPIRVKNISAVPVCGPVFAIVTGTMYDAESPVILNALNGKRWAGAAFEYSTSFGDFSCLGSGEISNSILWRFAPVQKHLDAGIPTFFRVRFQNTQ